MNKQAVEAAREKLAVAKSKIEKMKAAANLKELAQFWSEYLTEANRMFGRILRATKGNPDEEKWFKALKKFRSADDMLRYVEAARHADEHGIEKITQVTPGGVLIGFADPSKPVHLKHAMMVNGKLHIEGSNMKVQFQPGAVTLLPVKNFGTVYHPPKEHLGNPIEASGPIALAELNIIWLESALTELTSKFQ